MLYVEKSSIVEVIKYEPGMEDGFTCIPYVAECAYWDKENEAYFRCDKCTLPIRKKPFIGDMRIDEHHNLLAYQGGELIDVLTVETLANSYIPYNPANGS